VLKSLVHRDDKNTVVMIVFFLHTQNWIHKTGKTIRKTLKVNIRILNIALDLVVLLTHLEFQLFYY